MNKLQEICHPLIQELCKLWMFSQSDAPVQAAEQRHFFMTLLQDIREKSADDPLLERDFKRIEQPLVFFIDYTMRKILKDSTEKWRDIAMAYNELAGDEKFFDMLTQALDDPDSAPQLDMFYIFMGLGFDGVQSREFVERRMKVCATRLPYEADLNNISFSAADIMEKFQFAPARHRKNHYVRAGFAALIILCAAAFIANYLHFGKMTAAYQQALNQVTAEINSGFTADGKKSASPGEKNK